ncbi:MAG: NAD(P)/FAD-dependent oxidoreductase [Ekhidna sp.]|uniref:NAD(P)/FAD-dependent oxidoreductase n=1 Tax=Ekhidna sp. TaxID=2608089 RepID=UPI0032ECD621
MPIPQHLSLAIPESSLPRIVIVGGGFGGLNLAKGLRKTKAQVVLLDKNNFHTFQPLLYQVATAGLEPDSIAGPLRKAFDGQANYLFRMVKVTGVHPSKNEIETTVGSLSYDYLVMANGSVTNYFNKKDFRPKVLPLKRIVHALDLRSHILQNFEQAVMTKDEKELEKMMNIVVVGGGPTGVEVSGALAELKKHILPKDYPDLDFSQMKIHLIEGSDRLLNGMSDFAGKEALRYIGKMGINVQLNTFVEDYDGDSVKLNSGYIESATVIWSAGVRGNVVDGLDARSVERSRILVDEFNRVKGTENIFAIGDVAMMQSDKFPSGHPMVAPVAIQQGRHLANNLRRKISGSEFIPFKYFDKGSMATIGKNKAVVDMPNGMHFRGFMAWIIWMFVHIMYLIGFRNKLITLNNWIWSYFTYDKGTRLIIRTFNRKFLRRPAAINKI